MNDDHTSGTEQANPPRPAAAAGLAGRAPEVGDLDPRLTRAASRPLLDQIILEHDAAATGVCPGCGWPLSAVRRECPSRVLARAVRDRGPVPRWLAGLAHAVPGAVTEAPVSCLGSREEAENAQLGLFPAPQRVRPASGEDGAR